jgi:glycosyltransferase involved in cell wall biosynthesis
VKVLKKKLSIIGVQGVPARYGGFETLVENLAMYHHRFAINCELTIYASGLQSSLKDNRYLSANLKYVPLKANGVQSIPYDLLSLASALWGGCNVLLILGVSGAIAIPLIRLVSSARIVTNIDGIEWRRAKWRGLAKYFLRWSERLAVRYSHEVIADNDAIAAYVASAYRRPCRVIAYGGDHAVAGLDEGKELIALPIDLPTEYMFSVCRIEPENNIHLILKAFSGELSYSLVLVGNWQSSEYGIDLRAKYGSDSRMHLLDPIYDIKILAVLRSRAVAYIHGHSAGGTNPSLVEAMHFGRPIFAFDCDFNRSTTENKAIYFNDANSLIQSINATSSTIRRQVGLDMLEIARRRYVWREVSAQYFDLLI